MTSKPSKSTLRRAARALALTPALLVTGSAGAAFATAPSSWEDTPSVSGLHVILLLVLAPLGLFVLITLLVLLPSMKSGEHYQPGLVWRGEPTWFGGPREGVEAVDGAQQPAAVEAGTGDSGRGGVSGRW